MTKSEFDSGVGHRYYSIANGIGVGFISFAVINAFSKNAKAVHWLMWVVAAGFLLYFARGPIEVFMGH